MTEIWLEQLRRYLSNPKFEKSDFEEALNIKKDHIPKRLYKYRGINNNSLTNLSNDTVWCSNSEGFNDPYDSSWCFQFGDLLKKRLLRIVLEVEAKEKSIVLEPSDLETIKTTSEPTMELINRITSRAGRLVPDSEKKHYCDILNQIVDDKVAEYNAEYASVYKKGYKLSCFSEDRDSIVMWSHYASNHEGIVIEYDFSQLPIEDLRFRLLWPVIYSDKLFDATVYLEEQEKSGNPSILFGIIACIHKSITWSYEKEWRLVLPLSPSDPEQTYDVPKPIGVYLGARIKEEDKNKVLQIARNKSIPVYRMKLSYSEFQMTPDKIE